MTVPMYIHTHAQVRILIVITNLMIRFYVAIALEVTRTWHLAFIHFLAKAHLELAVEPYHVPSKPCAIVSGAS